MKPEQEYLPLSDMAQRHAGLSEPVAESWVEAARVCLDRHHKSPITFLITSAQTSPVTVEWLAANERSRNAWANENDATEFGA